MKIFLVLVSALLFVNSIVAQNCCCNIVQSVFGLVEAENRTIFKIYYPFSFDLCLVSTVGDADLYVSDRNPSPSYDTNSYLLHSATCGDDVIHVHKSLKRPIYVSVFGHPSFTVSQFYVNIVARESSEEDIINLQLLDLEDSKNISSTPVDDGDVPTVPCPANAVPAEFDTDQSEAISEIDTTENSDDLLSVLEKEETEDSDSEQENVSNSIDQNSTNNLESTSSEKPNSKESPRFFTSLFRTPTGFDIFEGFAEVFVEIIISIFL